jgi:mannose-6-phosphate isomerase
MIIDKPWGTEHTWAETNDYVGKMLFINKGERLSLKYHSHKTLTIYVIEGTMELVLDEGSRRDKLTFILNTGDTYHVKPLSVHRFCATQGTDVKLIEVSTIHKDDVVRIEDDYSRK